MVTKRILVVDDDHTSREAVGELLQDEGYEVALAADGHEAIAVFVSFTPDLVLTDLQMPRLDGIGLLNHLRRVSPTLPVMIFTADIRLDAEYTARRLGVQDYLNKPLDFEDILTRIARVFAS